MAMASRSLRMERLRGLQRSPAFVRSEDSTTADERGSQASKEAGARAMKTTWRKTHLIRGAVASLLLGLACLLEASAADEIARLAQLMEWKAGTVVADVGAGDGRFSFAAAAKVGPTGRVYATELDQGKLRELREEVKRRNLANVTVVVSKEADTGLGEG